MATFARGCHVEPSDAMFFAAQIGRATHYFFQNCSHYMWQLKPNPSPDITNKFLRSLCGILDACHERFPNIPFNDTIPCIHDAAWSQWVATSFDERTAQASLPTTGLSGLGAGLYSQTTFEEAAKNLEYESAIQISLSEPGPCGLSTSLPIEPQLAQAAMDTGDNSEVQESLYVTDPSSLAAVLQLEVTPAQESSDAVPMEQKQVIQTMLLCVRDAVPSVLVMKHLIAYMLKISG
ncbi:uncharacterized protein LOC142574416 [Dermacentor variabilis]|uniref:uncharacterized protein LOC142574416 n=1 Tax=Dermacentor variabilis TaxID=34621 RepID=UPI003F5B1285